MLEFVPYIANILWSVYGNEKANFMGVNMLDATISALNARDEHRLSTEIADRPRRLIARYVAGNGTTDKSGQDADIPPHLTPSEAEELKEALIDYILRSRGAYLETALSCLGAFRDPRLKGFLRDQLRKSLTDPKRFSGALAQCMLALEALGEPIAGGRDIISADVDRNARNAEAYLMPADT